MSESKPPDSEHEARKRALAKHIFVEPATKAVRHYLVEYLSLCAAEARGLSQSELLGPDGHGIAMDMAGALVWQDADEGVANDGWLNRRDEPVLCQLLDVSGVLDADANHADEWTRLFELAEHLKRATADE